MTSMKKCLKVNTVVLISFPFSDLSDKKVRPALVLRDQVDEDVVCLPISSSFGVSRNDLEIENEFCKNFTFPIKSFLRIQKIFTLHEDLVKKEIGSFTSEFFGEAKMRCLQFLEGKN